MKVEIKQMRNDFAVFILTHGRADSVLTTDTLKKCGNTNRIYYICDNEDTQLDLYQSKFGEENVIVFDKLAKSKQCDTMDSVQNRNIVLFARNSCFEIAEKLGLKYFLELDDDYTTFRSRQWDGNKLATVYCRDLDSVIDATIEFLEVSGATTVAFGQTGDFIGGKDCKLYKEKVLRKAMNSFFCKVDRPFDFLGRINEDVNAYVSLGSRGKLFFTICDMTLNQQDTQQRGGGLTEAYLSLGTYVKSFYTVMCNPSSVKISEMGCEHRRMHHLIDWNTAVPKIISSDFKK